MGYLSTFSFGEATKELKDTRNLTRTRIRISQYVEYMKRKDWRYSPDRERNGKNEVVALRYGVRSDMTGIEKKVESRKGGRKA